MLRQIRFRFLNLVRIAWRKNEQLLLQELKQHPVREYPLATVNYSLNSRMSTLLPVLEEELMRSAESFPPNGLFRVHRFLRSEIDDLIGLRRDLTHEPTQNSDTEARRKDRKENQNLPNEANKSSVCSMKPKRPPLEVEKKRSGPRLDHSVRRKLRKSRFGN